MTNISPPYEATFAVRKPLIGSRWVERHMGYIWVVTDHLPGHLTRLRREDADEQFRDSDPFEIISDFEQLVRNRDGTFVALEQL